MSSTPPGWPTIRLHQGCLLWHAARMKTGCRTIQSDHDTSGARLAAVLRASALSGYWVDCLVVKLDLPVQDYETQRKYSWPDPASAVLEGACYTCGKVADSPSVRPSSS
jgi:hypothetical protein